MGKLIPPDKKQCQAEKPNPDWSPFAFGPSPKSVRCGNIPMVIVTEKKPSPGYKKPGAMSLCGACLDVFNTQAGTPSVTVKHIRRTLEKILKSKKSEPQDNSAEKKGI